MPKRRADDAVNVVVTDHLIRRHPSSDLRPKLERHGRYSGPVKLLYPAALADTPLNRVYLSLGALVDRARMPDAINKLEAAIKAARPENHEFYRQLADALQHANRSRQAIQYYSEALKRKPGHVPTATGLANVLLAQGETSRAIGVLEKVGGTTSKDPALLNALAVAYGRDSRFKEAEVLLRRAIEIDEDLSLSWLNLGVCLQAQDKNAAAAQAYQEALRLQPDLKQARSYLELMTK